VTGLCIYENLFLILSFFPPVFGTPDQVIGVCVCVCGSDFAFSVQSKCSYKNNKTWNQLHCGDQPVSTRNMA